MPGREKAHCGEDPQTLSGKRRQTQAGRHRRETFEGRDPASGSRTKRNLELKHDADGIAEIVLGKTGDVALQKIELSQANCQVRAGVDIKSATRCPGKALVGTRTDS